MGAELDVDPGVPRKQDAARQQLHQRLTGAHGTKDSAVKFAPLDLPEKALPRLITARPQQTNSAIPADVDEAVMRAEQSIAARERRHRALETKANPATNRPVFQVTNYEVRGLPPLASNRLVTLLAKHTGSQLSENELISAAQDLQAECERQGKTGVSVAFAPKQIANGTVFLNVFEAASPQIVVAGLRYTPPPQTNAAPKFAVSAYEVTGDTLLSDQILTDILGDYTGTNIGVAEIMKAGSELQMEYRDRGYPTVNVTIPPQQITNGTVRIRVFEGTLASATVTNNRFFSSNNVMRALPGLRMGEVLVGPVFQSELDRANANQDRQIYPQLAPGPKENTTDLVLDVKDRLPLHGKIEFNNQSTPGTPETRVNSSAAYNNLWQLEHSVGVQYSFSPEDYKADKQWPFYDRPLVANYSAFYRMPIGFPEPVENDLASPGGNFGYDEASRRFRLPPPSNRPELNFYASRSTIDTGVQPIFHQNITNDDGTIGGARDVVQKDITINASVGARLSLPMPSEGDLQSAFSFGADFKSYRLTSAATNVVTIYPVSITDPETGEVHTTPGSTNYAPNPTNGPIKKSLDYLPITLRYDGSIRDPHGITSFGLGLSVNAWYSGSVSNLHLVSGSTNMAGNWIIVTPSLTRDFISKRNWTLSLRLDGQVASEPLISNEQYGAGGVNTVRGYREGEVFGDDGWRASIEEKTPGYIIGSLGGGQRLAVRGSIFADYAEAYLLDPQGRHTRTPLLGIGASAVISLGTYWEVRMIFADPILRAGSTEAFQPRFNFAITGQF